MQAHNVNSTTNAEFNIVEASIEDHRKALDAGEITSVDLLPRLPSTHCSL